MDNRKTLKILFVGSGHVGLLVSEEIRDHAGHSVETESSPEKALMLLSGGDHDFDLLITGNRIQGENDVGMDLVRWAKKNCPEIKVILMSVFPDNEDRAISAGADAFWHTSYDLSGLMQLIEELFPDAS